MSNRLSRKVAGITGEASIIGRGVPNTALSLWSDEAA
jgi:hypothetical protein